MDNAKDVSVSSEAGTKHPRPVEKISDYFTSIVSEAALAAILIAVTVKNQSAFARYRYRAQCSFIKYSLNRKQPMNNSLVAKRHTSSSSRIRQAKNRGRGRNRDFLIDSNSDPSVTKLISPVY